ncbi:MAG: rod shape-determining protein MreD [Bacteroidaceae bacterium]|nr:rod shape-determining protein MreD [Bacteroidaceae bacterium]
MINDVVNKTLWMLGLVLLQALLFSKITVAGVATPLPYIYLLITWNKDGTRWILLLVGFLLGLIIDSFANLPGINAASCVLLAMMQPVYLSMFTPRELQDERSLIPAISTIRWDGFLMFAFLCVLTHHITMVALEYFSINDLGGMLIRIVGCSLLTMAFILVFEMLRMKGRS